MKKKKPKSLYTFLKPKLRRASMYWRNKKIARDMARVDVQEGFYKNGNPKFVKKFICAECERLGSKKRHLEHLSQMDHIIPIRDVKEELFDGDWTKYITNLFCDPEGYQCLCIAHHEEKTQKENLQRTFSKKNSSKSKKSIKIATFPKNTTKITSRKCKKT